MQRRRVLLIALVAVWLAVPLATTSIDPTTYDSTLIEPMNSSPEIVPIDQATVADSFAYVNTWMAGIGHGEIIDFQYLKADDSNYASLEEELVGGVGGTSFQRVFQFSSFAEEYLSCMFEVRGYDYSGVPWYEHESLKFSYSQTSVGPWTEVGVMNSETATSYSWQLDVPDSQYLYIMVEDTNNEIDSLNEWKLDYIRIKCIDRKSQNLGVSLNTAHDGDNLYPFKGEGNDDFYKFSCTVSNEEGANFIHRVHLKAVTEANEPLWAVEWHASIWDVDSWSDGVNLIELECSEILNGPVLTIVFAIQFTYSCDAAFNIDFILSHDSDTWSSETRYDRDTSARDLDQEPALQYEIEPSLPELCNPGSSPSITGKVTFAASPSGQVPNPSYIYVNVWRVDPGFLEWFGGTWLDATGSFIIECPTEGGVGTRNRFRVSIYDSETLDNDLGPVIYVATRLDAVEVYEDGATATTIPIGESTTIYVKLRYDWNGTEITEGTVVWNGIPLTYTPENQSWIAYLEPHYEPTTMIFNSLSVTTTEGINTVSNPASVTIRWTKLGVTLHLDSIVTHIPVSTVYDPHSFTISISLTDQNQATFAGWINLTIAGEEFSVYYNGTHPIIFNYYPRRAGSYSLFALYEGDLYHNASNQTIVGLNAMHRSMDYDYILPTSMNAQEATLYSFFNVYDDDYLGVFEEVTYIRDYPINVSMSIWWTLSPDFGEPRNFVGEWDIILGEGSTSWALPWDLDNDGRLTNDDLLVYVVILLHGQDVFNDVTLQLTIDVKQKLLIDMDLPELTYSDSIRFEVNALPLHDPLYSGDLRMVLELYASTDNESWAMIDVISTDVNGRGYMTWTCDCSGPVYFKCEAISDIYSSSTRYDFKTASKEGTRLRVNSVDTFTYSDQGVLTIFLTTDDYTPLPDYPVYIEILDDVWISIGTGLTNESGYANILWTPELPSGTYDIKVRAPMTESEFYNGAEECLATVIVNRENLIITIDEESGSNGYVGAQLTDDEGNPIEGATVSFFLVGDSQPIGTTVTDSEGHAKLEVTLAGSRVLRVLFEESEFYKGSFEEMNISAPLDVTTLLLVCGGLLSTTFIVSVVRKKRGGSSESIPKPVPPEVRKELEKESELIPERRREETERKIAELDGGFDDVSGP